MAKANGERRTALLLSCGVIGPSLFTVVYLIEGAVLPDYNSLRQSISELSLSYQGWFQITSFIICICLLLIGCFAFGLWQNLRGAKTKIATWKLILLAVVGVVFIFSGFFREYAAQSYLPTPLRGEIHVIIAIAVIVPLLGLVAYFVFVRPFAGDARWKYWIDVIIGILMPTSFVLFMLAFFGVFTIAGIDGRLAGLLERFSIIIGMVWLVFLAFRRLPGRFSQRVLLIVVAMVMLIITFIWILSALGTISGALNTILTTFSTVLGIAIGLWPLFLSIRDRIIDRPEQPRQASLLIDLLERVRSQPYWVWNVVLLVTVLVFFASHFNLKGAPTPTPVPVLSSPTPTPTPKPTPTPTPIPVPFQVTVIDLSVSPLSIAAIPCGTQLTVTYTATFHALPYGRGGAVQIIYTTDGGRTTKSGLVQFSPGETSKQFRFTSTGTLAQNSAFPGVGQVTTTSPNALFSQALTPSSSCTPVPTPRSTPTPTLTPTPTATPPSDTVAGFLLQLLIVPVLLVIGGFGLIVLAFRGFRLQKRIALDNRREAALQAYLTQIADRIDEYSSDKKHLEETIRARTLLLLRSLTRPPLDAERKGSVLQFLYESGLIDKDKHIIDLLSEADLSGANLRDANLSGADLKDANLSEADLSGADLSGADVRDANLSGADLKDANLSEADLSGAKLSGAKVTEAQLKEVKLLEGATMPDGSKHL